MSFILRFNSGNILFLFLSVLISIPGASFGKEWRWLDTSKTVSDLGQNLQSVSRRDKVPMAVWFAPATVAGQFSVVSSEYKDFKWSPPVTVSMPENVSQLKLATTGLNTVHAVWVGYPENSTKLEIKYARYQDQRWSNPYIIGYASSEIGELSIGANDSGVVTVIWPEGHAIRAIRATEAQNSEQYTIGITDDDTWIGRVATNNGNPSIALWQEYKQTGSSPPSYDIQVKAKSFINEAWGNEIILAPVRSFDYSHDMSLVANEFEPGHIVAVFGGKAATFSSDIGWSNATDFGIGSLGYPYMLLKNDHNGLTAMLGSGYYSCDSSGCNFVEESYNVDYMDNKWGEPKLVGSKLISATSDDAGVITSINSPSCYSCTGCISQRYKNSSLSVIYYDNDSKYCSQGASLATSKGEDSLNIFRDGLYFKSRTGTDRYSSLSSAIQGNGTILIDDTSCSNRCNGVYEEGSQVHLMPISIPETGYGFAGWSGDCSGASDCLLLMDVDKNVTADFVVLPKYPLSVSRSRYGIVTNDYGNINCGSGFISCQAPYFKGSTAKLSATPNNGYYLKAWINCTEIKDEACLVKIAKPKMTVRPIFSPLPKYKLTIVKSKYGSIVSNPAGLKCGSQVRKCSAKFTTGTGVTLTLKPLTGHTYIGWSGACEGVTSDTCTIEMDAPKTVGAIFQ